MNEGEVNMGEMKKVFFEGGEMDYFVFGNGRKPFVILPGLSIHSVLNFAEAVEKTYCAASDEYRVYLLDYSAHAGDGCSICSLAEDTAAAFRALGLEKAYVLGVSMGGMTALLLAAFHPETVGKLILASTLSKSNETFRSVCTVWLKNAEKHDGEALIGSFLDYVYSEKTLSKYRKTLIESNKEITDGEYRRTINLVRACRDYDSYEFLPLIKCPVLVIGSMGDRVVTAEASREIASFLSCALYLYDSSYGHAVYDEAPDYLKRCLDFFGKD